MAAFIFDLDGTLLNTLDDLGNACNVILEAHGFPGHPAPAYRQMVGNGFATLVKRALPHDYKPDDIALQRLVCEAKAWYASHMMDFTRPYAGMEQALETLSETSRLAVLSNKPDELTVALIRHYFANIPFRIIRGGRENVPLKPDPAALLEMLAEMDVSPESACYVGDSNVDIQTAKNAKVASIGVAWGFRGAAELREAGASHIVDAPGDLIPLAEE